jgi:hypothetical protein
LLMRPTSLNLGPDVMADYLPATSFFQGHAIPSFLESGGIGIAPSHQTRRAIATDAWRKTFS